MGNGLFSEAYDFERTYELVGNDNTKVLNDSHDLVFDADNLKGDKYDKAWAPSWVPVLRWLVFRSRALMRQTIVIVGTVCMTSTKNRGSLSQSAKKSMLVRFVTAFWPWPSRMYPDSDLVDEVDTGGLTFGLGFLNTDGTWIQELNGDDTMDPERVDSRPAFYLGNGKRMYDNEYAANRYTVVDFSDPSHPSFDPSFELLASYDYWPLDFE